MGAYTCEFGVVHKVCRCPDPHSIKCDVPSVHGGNPVTGEWTHKQSLIHSCEKPSYDSSVRRGDRWRCAECKTEWIVNKIDGDQRDGSTWIVWKKYTQEHGIYAPGTK